MSTIMLLLHVHIWNQESNHLLSHVMNWAKMPEEGHVWVQLMYRLVKLVYIDYKQSPVFRKRPFIQCPQLFCYYMFIFFGRGHHLLSLVMNGVIGTEEGHVWVPAMCQMAKRVSANCSLCLVFRRRPLMQFSQLFCSCIFIFETEAITCHLWQIEQTWLRKDLYGYQHCVNWYSWFILIINSEKVHWYNANQYFDMACSYLWQRPSFVTGDEWSQKWLKNDMYRYGQCVNW
jgi:hypothetical protein